MFIFAALCGVVLVAGCRQAVTTSDATSAQAAAYRLSEEPTGAKGVMQLKEVAADGDDIVVEARIGGASDPWVSGQAAFLVVDSSLKPCNEKDDDSCETPWDYCCDVDLLPKAKAMVKVVDENGKPLATDARELLGLKELQTVVVRGKAKRDEAGNLTILADGVFVRN
jgi:hypothetical protein